MRLLSRPGYVLCEPGNCTCSSSNSAKIVECQDDSSGLAGIRRVELAPAAVGALNSNDVADEPRVDAPTLARHAEKRRGFELEVVHHRRAVLENRRVGAVQVFRKAVSNGNLQRLSCSQIHASSTCVA